MKRLLLTAPLLLLATQLALAEGKTVGRLAEGTIVRMSTSRRITWQTLELSYSCRIRTPEKNIKQPLLYLTVLTENADGERLLFKYYTVAGTDTVNEADPPYKHWGRYDVAGFTMDQLKVFHEEGWPPKVLSWGETKEIESSEVRTVSRKRLKVRIVDKDIELLAWRLELWHDGALLGTRSKPVKATLLRKQIPLNWYTAKKGPFIPPEPEQAEPKAPTRPEPEPEKEVEE
jgi:hypothetical protein